MTYVLYPCLYKSLNKPPFFPSLQQHFVTEWVGDKHPEQGLARTPEPAPERPLRISSDPEVLATQLNALPGMACSPQVYSTPKHYVRFSSPFLANRSPTTPGVPTGRRRSRELPETPPTTGSCKKVRLPPWVPTLAQCRRDPPVWSYYCPSMCDAV